MASQVVPNQQHPQRRQLVWQARRIEQAALPTFPQRTRAAWVLSGLLRPLCGQNRAEFGLQPAVQDLIGARVHAFDANLTAGRMEQC